MRFATSYRYFLLVTMVLTLLGASRGKKFERESTRSEDPLSAQRKEPFFSEQFRDKSGISKSLGARIRASETAGFSSLLTSRMPRRLGVSEQRSNQDRQGQNRTLPLFLFIAGVEGSGHHALGIALERCFDVSFSFAPDVWVAQYYSLTPYVWTNASEFYERLSSNSYGVSVIGANAVLDYQHSFPFGWFRSALFHPDLSVLNELDGEYFDLRVIFLHRDPAETVSSALSRGFVKDPFLQARIVESALMYMDRFLEVMPPEKAVVIHYDRYRKQPLEYVDVLSRVSGYCDKEDLRNFMIEADLVMDRFRNQRPRHVDDEMCPKDIRRRPEECDGFEARLRTWFAARSKYWPFLTEERLS
ncbi:hypothetical protein CCYA_CCYA18G4554 [Cyanidiococcus yangmingshanensis]|nr:hypothetical protein CCYA_CCYA18G4554 [Cyanidiococcus yangmingshanensis]